MSTQNKLTNIEESCYFMYILEIKGNAVQILESFRISPDILSPHCRGTRNI